MYKLDLNNPIFREAMLQVINRRFIVIGADMHPIKTDCGDQQCLQLTFVEAPDQYVFLPLSKFDKFKKRIEENAEEKATETPIENPTSAPAEKAKKIYVYDTGWQGSVICVAESEEEALRKMIASGDLDQNFYDRNKEHYRLAAYDIGTVASTVGDNIP